MNFVFTDPFLILVFMCTQYQLSTYIQRTFMCRLVTKYGCTSTHGRHGLRICGKYYSYLGNNVYLVSLFKLDLVMGRAIKRRYDLVTSYENTEI